MSVPLELVSNIRFDPSRYDSVLNSHSSSSDTACNIDNNLVYECAYYDHDNFNSTNFNKSNLSLFHHNSRSLNKNSNNILDYVTSLNHTFDIYGFTETWFRSNTDSDIIDIHGYMTEHCIREGRTGGGASLFINPKFNYIARPDLKLNCPDCDSVFIEIPDKPNTIIGVIY